MATSTLDPYDELRSQLDTAFVDALKKARVWLVIYIFIRASMIVFSVLTSADAVKALGAGTPIFGIIVALLAAFDSWLKPDVKYRIHYTANDSYTRLTRKLSRIGRLDPTDPKYATYWPAPSLDDTRLS